jgi:hypothetical protein
MGKDLSNGSPAQNGLKQDVLPPLLFNFSLESCSVASQCVVHVC